LPWFQLFFSVPLGLIGLDFILLQTSSLKDTWQLDECNNTKICSASSVALIMASSNSELMANLLTSAYNHVDHLIGWWDLVDFCFMKFDLFHQGPSVFYLILILPFGSTVKLGICTIKPSNVWVLKAMASHDVGLLSDFFFYFNSFLMASTFFNFGIMIYWRWHFFWESMCHYGSWHWAEHTIWLFCCHHQYAHSQHTCL
jgi:hypothetical protein